MKSAMEIIAVIAILGGAAGLLWWLGRVLFGGGKKDQTPQRPTIKSGPDTMAEVLRDIPAQSPPAPPEADPVPRLRRQPLAPANAAPTQRYLIFDVRPPAPLWIEYGDSEGVVTERLVMVRGFETEIAADDDPDCIRAWCTLRNAHRRFFVGRVLRALDGKTQAPVADVAGWLKAQPTRKRPVDEM